MGFLFSKPKAPTFAPAIVPAQAPVAAQTAATVVKAGDDIQTTRKRRLMQLYTNSVLNLEALGLGGGASV